LVPDPTENCRFGSVCVGFYPLKTGKTNNFYKVIPVQGKDNYAEGEGTDKKAKITDN
jgi:hypothetical protein